MFCQSVYKQEIIKGGVSIIGNSLASSAFLDNHLFNFPNNGNIKDAYLITYLPRPSDNFEFNQKIYINNLPLIISDKDIVSIVKTFFPNSQTLENFGIFD